MDPRKFAVGLFGLSLVAGWPIGVVALPMAPVAAMAQEAEELVEEDETLQEMMILSIDRSSATYFLDLMNFDDFQRDLAMELYREYFDQYRSAAVTTRDVMLRFEESMEEGDFDYENFEEVMRQTMTIVLGFLDRAISLGDQFVGDLGDLAVDESQRAGHQRVIYARQRGLAVSMSTMNGGDEGLVDLVSIGRDLDPPLLATDGGGPAEQAMFEYERELGTTCGPMVDRALEGLREMLESISTGDENDRMEESLERDMEALVDRFEGINDRYARRVQAALPDARRGEWDNAYKKARWPEVYAAGDVHRTRDAALELEGLTDEQRETITATMEHYAREAEGANQRWISAVQDLDEARRDLGEDSTPDDWEAYQDKNQAVRDARAAREALDERFAERIVQVLTPEQREAMPSVGGGDVDVDAVIRELGGG